MYPKHFLSTSISEREASQHMNQMSAKRNRKPVSCDPCRQRKLKCNRALPACESCLRRGDVTSCIYQARKPGSQRYWPASHRPADSIESRMAEMERRILIMMDKASHPNFGPLDDAEPLTSLSAKDQSIQQGSIQARGSPSPDLIPVGLQPSYQREQPPKRNEIMEIGADSEGVFCVGEAHWAVLLNGIAEVRDYLKAQRHQNSIHTQNSTGAVDQLANKSVPSLGLGLAKPVSRREILSQLPSQPICDALVARYFYTLEPALHILHIPTFRKQYAEFRDRPHQVPHVWIGLLCAVMRIATLSWQREGSEPPDLVINDAEMAEYLRSLATNALMLADYAQPQEHLVQALCLHMHGEYIAVRDANPNVYILLGMIVRSAMTLGYHREQRIIPELGPFQGEMRRRVWAYIRMADILFSFQAGLPSMIRIRDCDANLPRNIHDDAAFYETCPELPSPRLDSEITQVSFMIIKSRLIAGFARALKEMNSPVPTSYDRVLEIDRELRQMYEDVPGYFQLRAISHMASEPLPVIASRFMLANIHHKSICVVHSRYLEAARSNVRYLYSRRACLESAMRLLGFQALQHELATMSDGKQATTRYQTSLTTHDYLLGATVICAELSLTRDPVNVAQRKDSGPARSELLMALRRSAQRWHQMRDYSAEAQKASDLLGMLCLKFLPVVATDQHTVSGPFRAHKDPEYSPSSNRHDNVSTKPHITGEEGGGGNDYPDRSELPLEAPPSPLGFSRNEIDAAQSHLSLSNHQNQPLASGTSAQMLGAGCCRSTAAPFSAALPDTNTIFAPDSSHTNHLAAHQTQSDTDLASWDTTLTQSFDLGDPFGTLWNFNSGRNLPFYEI